MNTNVLTLHSDTAPADDDLRGQIAALQARDKRYTQARIAKEAGFSATVMSQWLAGNYPGDNEEVERKLRRWLDTTLAQAEQAAAMPAAPDYVATPSAEKVIAALRYAQLAGDIAVVYGGAGLGKSTGIRQHALQAPNVWHATMTPASASVVTCMEEIAEAVGAGGTVGGAAKLHRIICRRVANSGGLIVVDEAQHLSVAALDQIRSIHDATGIGIALVGNEAVYARMTGGNRAAFLDRLFSRIGKRVRLTRASQADVNLLLEAWGVTEKACRGQLLEIASKPGALRQLTKVLRLASLYAAAEGRRLCCDDVRTAWRELGGVE